MIENLTQMRQIVIDATGLTVYLEYPQKAIPRGTDYAIISLVSSVPTLSESDGSEVMARLTYNIHIYAHSQTDVLEYCSKISAKCEKYNFTRLSMSPGWNDATLGPYRTLTISGTLDKRGNVFQ